jgi:hypothetical protein
MQILFRFDSVDGNTNSFEGWWIDNVNVSRSSATPTLDDDQFTIDLSSSVGRAVDIVLSGQAGADYSAQTLELWNPTGTTMLASGVSDPIQTGNQATNYDLGIIGYEVTSPGIYRVRIVSSNPGGQYGLLVSSGVAIETESNAETQLRTLRSPSPALSGYLRSDATRTYTSRGPFEADNGGLAREDFEGGVVDANDIRTFSAPLNQQTANEAFASGIAAGLSITAGGNGDIALVGSDFFDGGEPGSQAVGADAFQRNTNLSFAPAVTAVGFDVLSDGDVTVRIYNAAGRIIRNASVRAEASGTFFGATNTEPISRVELIETQRKGELVDNIVFGTASVSPTPDADSFIVSASAGQTIRLTTATPLDAISRSPRNNLDPRLEVTGPGVNISDINSVGDGRNATVTFTAGAAGDYVVRVSARSGEGEYIVRMDDGTSVDSVRSYLDFEDFVVLAGSGQELLGVDFSSAEGNLVPVPLEGGQPVTAPFGFALSNTPEQITFGNLQTPTVLDGTVRTKIRVNGDPALIDAFWGNGPVATTFKVENASCSNPSHSILKVDACATNISERDVILAELNTVAGDLDGNQQVDFADFLQLSAAFGGSGSYTEGNIDLDGAIGFADFLILADNFGR